MEHRGLVALGANLGDREKTILAAWETLGRAEGVQTVCLSSLREYPAVSDIVQGDFLNAVGVLRTCLEPLPLLDLLLEIEQRFGRVRLVHWGPRTLDLDLLLYDDKVISAERLTVPHPLMSQRRFVLEPAAEVAADWVHPALGKTIRELLARLDQPHP
ncbi:MAG: 2-amino-4-hydroxy-6-hydroxymethyldihydropteridine diphosphokinase [Thermoguttaceae bacterium]|nr:2-amino-4-hydroxy-6-hydroxymethyldihydropteridine diphosphokinase [Thermoguttaceae bacterium]